MKKLYGLFLVVMLYAGMSAQDFGKNDDYAAAAGYGTISVNCCLVDGATGAAINNARVYAFFKSASNVRSAETEAAYSGGNYTLNLSSYYSGKGYISVRAVGYESKVLNSLSWQSGKTYTYPISLKKAKAGGLVRWAALRSSFYGAKDPGDNHFYPFPASEEWEFGAETMNLFFVEENVTPPGQIEPTLVWTVSEWNCKDPWGTYLDFKTTATINDTTIKKNTWDELDASEYLDYFDNFGGARVFLQIEPGMANMSDLIKLVFDKMNPNDHPCIVGLGVDVEFYKKDEDDPGDIGQPVTGADAKAWLDQIRTYKPELRLFLKHWLKSQMPTTNQADIIFVNDSQGDADLDALTSTMGTWSDDFSKNDVMYQVGYPVDKDWWDKLAAPFPKSVGNKLIANAANDGQNVGVIWVDFSMRDVPELKFPKNSSTTTVYLSHDKHLLPAGYTVTGNPTVGNYALDVDQPYSYTVKDGSNNVVSSWKLYQDWNDNPIATAGTLTMDHDRILIFKLDYAGFPPWKLGATYKVGNMVSYNKKIYQCLQAHTAYAANWNPEQAPALWKLVK